MSESPGKSVRPPIRFRRKVVLYATRRGQLLVFTEPDFPEAGIQVPGGTVEEGEAIEAAARREFREETGLDAPERLELLGERSYVFEAGGVRHQHLRHYFHLELDGAPSDAWEGREETPDGGGPPIRLAFSFVPLFPVVPVLFARLDALFPELLIRLRASEAAS